MRETLQPAPTALALPALNMSYGAANQLLSVNGEATTFDADGNMTFGPLQEQMTEFSYDSRNRLSQAGSTHYHYDAENQRIGVDQLEYVVNAQPALSQVLVKTENGQSTLYVYGLGLIGAETEGTYHSYHFDYRGSTVALTDEQAQQV